MTEKLLYAKIRPWLDYHGASTRIENAAGVGMPDVIYATHGVLMWIELKIEHSGKIKIESFQYSFATRMMKHIYSDRYWFAIKRPGLNGVEMFRWLDLKDLPTMSLSDGVSIDIRDTHGTFHLKSSKDMGLWLNLIGIRGVNK